MDGVCEILRRVERTIERYGDGVEPPAQATVLFRGIDPQVGAITKYTVVDADGHA